MSVFIMRESIALSDFSSSKDPCRGGKKCTAEEDVHNCETLNILKAGKILCGGSLYTTGKPQYYTGGDN